jgi:hypothetical protein
MSANPDEPIVVCVNSEAGLKRHEECIGGQLWIQGNRQITATNKVFEGMSNDTDSATLAGITEAVEWTHVLEEAQELRSTRRIVIYPPTSTEFTRVLSGDTSNLEEGHEIAYQRISTACSKYSAPPEFYSADSELWRS